MTTSTEQNPDFVYPDIGVYPVSFTVHLTNGQTATVKRKVVIFELITTDFTYELQPCLDVQFTDTSSISETIVSWLWDFGDGSFSTVQNPLHTYIIEDEYDVTLTIQTSAGGIGVKTDTLAVAITDNVVADYTYSDSLGTVTFTDMSTTDSSIISWDWDFGDGSAHSSLQNPIHSYADNDTYNVILSVTSSCGIVDDFTDSLVITDVFVPVENPISLGGSNWAVMQTDGYLSTTTDNGATWTNTNLFNPHSGLTRSFLVDPFTPLYKGTGSQVNGWMVGIDLTGGVYRIYKVDDLFGTPTVTSQHSFGSEDIATSGLLKASTVDQDTVLCSYNFVNPAHSNKREAWVAITTDGTNWTEVQVSPVGQDVYSVNAALNLSSYQSGLARTAYSTGGSDTNYAIYESGNYGNSWSLVRTIADATPFIYSPPSDIDDSVYWYTANGTSKLYYYDGATDNDLTPTYIPKTAYGISTYIHDSMYVAVAGLGSSSLTACFISTNGGSSWTTVQSTVLSNAPHYTGCIHSNSNPNHVLFYGKTTTVHMLSWWDGTNFGVSGIATTLLHNSGNILYVAAG